MKKDGNVAFKVTWVYGKNGPFTSPCTQDGRRINIKEKNRVWCNQPDNECYKAFITGNRKILDDRDMPCYDCAIFRKWSFGGGVYHHGKKKDEPIPFKNFEAGRYAFFTTRDNKMGEEDRIVVGAYVIDRAIEEPDFGIIVAAARKGSEIRVADFRNAPKFWKYHHQNGPPKWGTGLFRYLTHETADRLYKAVSRAAGKS